MYVMSIKVPIRKKSGNLLNVPRNLSVLLDICLLIHFMPFLVSGHLN